MIKLILLDVDGTMTDGGIYIDGIGGGFKKFNVKDKFFLCIEKIKKISLMLVFTTILNTIVIAFEYSI